MAITEFSKNYHEKMFPKYHSAFWKQIQNLLSDLTTLRLTKL